jgi:hypothetical protein
MFGRWKKGVEKHRADDRHGDVQALDRIAYRFARPEDVVEEDGTATSGPGGAPEDPLDVEERRDRDRAAG